MARTMNRRSFLAHSAAAAAGVAAIGAAGDLLGGTGAAWGATNGPGRNGISTAKPKKGGSVIFGVVAEETGFNVTTTKLDNVGIMYSRTVFDPLAIVDATGGWRPYLAQSIVPNADYTAWTITLRPDVVFHDTTPLNGAALLMNFEAHLHSLISGPAMQPVVSTITQTGPMSVTVKLKQPWVPFPFYLTGGYGGQLAYPMAPAMINAPTGGTDHPIGTGPFKFKQWIPNTHFTATAWSRYWRPGLPHLSSITYKPIPDATACSEALMTGTIDMLITDTPQTIVLYRGKKQWSYIDDSGTVVGQPTMNFFQLNLSKPPFNTPKVRLAAALAINRQAYSSVIDIGVNPVSTGLFVKGTPYYSTSGYPKYNPAQAKKLVAQVQQATGKPVAFTMGGVNDPATVRATLFCSSSWRTSASRSPRCSPAGRADRQRPGGHIPVLQLAPVRRGRPRPELHLLEHHHGQRQRPLGQHGPQQRPQGRGGPPGRAHQLGPGRPGQGLPEGQPAVLPRTSHTFGATGRCGPSSPSPTSRTSTTRPCPQAARPSA